MSYLLGFTLFLCAVALCPLSACVAIPSLIFTFWHFKRGWIFSIFLLAVSVLVFPDFWHLGISISLSLSLWTLWTTHQEKQEKEKQFLQEVQVSLALQLELEQKLKTSIEENSTLQCTLDAKAASFQGRIEEMEKEKSSLLILNEVLRKTTAVHIEEKNELEKQSVDLERKIASLREEVARAIAKPLDFHTLLKELNQERVAGQQMRLINEQLVKMHAQKCQELETLKEETLSISTPLQLSHEQLKRQFEEKDQTLHETRKELFLKDTEAQALKIEQETVLDFEYHFLSQVLEEQELEKKEIFQENRHLTEWISQLLQEKKTKKKSEKTFSSISDGAPLLSELISTRCKKPSMTVQKFYSKLRE